MYLDERQKEIIQKVLEGRYSPNELSRAFIFSDTPEGHYYWASESGSEELSQEAREKLTKMLGNNMGNQGVTSLTGEYQIIKLTLINGELTRDKWYNATPVTSLVVEESELGQYYVAKADLSFRGMRFHNHPSVYHEINKAVVKVEDGGEFSLVGNLTPVEKAFGFKSLEDYYKFFIDLYQGTSELHFRQNWENYDGRNSIENFCKFLDDSVNRGDALNSALFYRPVFSQEGVSCYINYRDMMRDRRTTISVGKFLRKIFVGIKDADLEKMVDYHNKQHTKRDFTLLRSKEAKDFYKAYNGKRVEMLNPKTTDSRKSIANSCMRDMEFDGHSPAEMYASGDFEILWLESPEGRVGGRCVVYVPSVGKPQAGPVYGSCEHSMDLLEEALQGMGAEMYNNASWSGAKLLKIDTGYGMLICYSDLEEEARDFGDYMVITSGSGEINLCVADGISEDDRAYCDSCDDRIHLDDSYHSESGGIYCESCYEELFIRCSVTDEEIRVDDSVEVLTSNSSYYWGASVQNPKWIIVDANSVDFAECQGTGDVWLLEDMVSDVDDQDFSPKYAANNLTLINGVYYSEEQLVEHGLKEEEEDAA